MIDLAEVERLLVRVDGVATADVIAVPAESGHILEARVVVDDPGLDGPAVRRRFGAMVAPAMTPTRVIVVTGRGTSPTTREERATRLPSDPLEREIADLWGRALGLVVQRDDDFFELGGDHSLAARTVALIEDRRGIRLPMSVLLTNATLAQLVPSLDDPTTTASTVVEIQRGVRDRPPVVLAYDLDGSALTMRDLALAIGADLKVWGLDSPLRLGDGSPRDIPAIARRHVRDLVAVLPEGPYLLAGYSLGAFLVYEMALQLQATGRDVSFVGLLDMGPVHVRHPLGPRQMVHPGDRWPWRPRSDLSTLDRWRARVAYLRGQPSGHRAEAALRAMRVGPTHDLIRCRVDLARHNRVRQELRSAWCWYQGMNALVAYEVPRTDSLVNLFVSDQTAKGNFRVSPRLDYASRTDSTLGWSAVAPNVRTWPVMGSHADLIEQPYVWGLGDLIRAAVEEAARESASHE